VLIQSAAAIQTKLWMRACFREGVVPVLQMHDSLDLSVLSSNVSEMVARLGENIVSLEVPMKVDVKYGRTWGDAKHTWAELYTETSSHVEPTGEIPGTPERTAPETPKFSNDSDDTPDSVPTEDIVMVTLNEISSTPKTEQPPWERASAFSFEPAPKSEPVHSDDGFAGFTTDREGAQCGKILCPFHEEKTPSCQLYADGHYHCFGCGAHGWVEEDLGLDSAALAACTPQDDGQTLARGLKLWDESEPIARTLAARYLTDIRKLDLTVLTNNIDAVLRFHSRCPFGANGARHPCLLALFRDVESDAPAGIHRIGLTPNAEKIKRLTLGRWANPRAIKLWPLTHKLSIGEGVETVLAAVRCGAITPPAWAMGPKADIAKFPVLPGIKAITVLVDRGDPAALDGAEACAARYVAAGIPARWLRTVRVKDFNDLVLT